VGTDRAPLCRHREPDAIRAALGSAAADVARIAPALRDRCPDLGDGVPVDPDHAELRVHESLVAFVARAAAAQPLLIIIDDAQWADAASLRVLRALAEELPHTRALVLALCAAAGDDGRLAEPHTLRVELDGVSTAAVADLIAHTLGQPAPDDVVGAIAELAAGNPLVVVDTLRHLSAAALLPPRRPAWLDRAAIARAGLADATCAMVSRRLRRLDPACRRVLAIAAVAGDAFTFAAVERVAALAGDAALPAFESAADAALIRPLDATGARYRFATPYLGAAIRQGLNPTRRAYLQIQLGAAPATNR